MTLFLSVKSNSNESFPLRGRRLRTIQSLVRRCARPAACLGAPPTGVVRAHGALYGRMGPRTHGDPARAHGAPYGSAGPRTGAWGLVRARQALHGIFGQPFTRCFCGAWEFLGYSSGPLERGWQINRSTIRIFTFYFMVACHRV